MGESSTSVSWISATETAVKLAANAAEAQKEATDLDAASGYLSPLESAFRELIKAASIVRAFGWEGVTPSSDLVRNLADAGETLDSRPLNRVAASLERFQSQVQTSIVETWDRHASEQIGDVRELLSLAGTLSAVEGVSELSKQLQTTLGKLARNQGGVPTDGDVKLLAQAETTLHNLEASLQPESVRTFLSAVARGGASTELLTRDVVTWLKTHNASGNFRIVAGAPTNV